MTVDDSGEPPDREPRPVPPRRSTRDLERYAALFAARTKVMKSSAMRDLMAITERPEVISLAGGLPDTSTFPAESLAALTSKMAAGGRARRWGGGGGGGGGEGGGGGAGRGGGPGEGVPPRGCGGGGPPPPPR